MRKLTLCGLAATLITSISLGAEAARFRLHLDTALFHFSKSTYEYSEEDDVQHPWIPDLRGDLDAIHN